MTFPRQGSAVFIKRVPANVQQRKRLRPVQQIQENGEKEILSIMSRGGSQNWCLDKPECLIGPSPESLTRRWARASIVSQGVLEPCGATTSLFPDVMDATG